MSDIFTIHDFENEQQWLKGRMNGIGGSDASVTIGRNPYKSNVELYEEKIGKAVKFAGTVESGTLAEYGDDGVTQKATVKTGIASKGDAIVPNPVKLKGTRWKL